MKILLDTCTFLWIVSGEPELSDDARRLFSNPENDIYLSVVSVWEMIVKQKIGKLPLPGPAHEVIPQWKTSHQIESLPLTEESVLQLVRIPEYHKDPFDRMLICQAIADGLTILTPDAGITQYPVRTAW